MTGLAATARVEILEREIRSLESHARGYTREPKRIGDQLSALYHERDALIEAHGLVECEFCHRARPASDVREVAAWYGGTAPMCGACRAKTGSR